MDKVELYRQIAAEAASGELVFPTNAEVSMRIKRMLDDPDCAIDQVAKLVQAEPLLAARVIAIANSVTYNRSGREITDLRQAVARLGFRTLRALTMSVLIRQIAAQSTVAAHKALAQKLWEHTAHVAALCHVVAKRVTRQDPETALLAGILHEVAGFYLIARAKEMPELLEGDMPGWQGEGEKIVGNVLLGVLEAPEAVVAALGGMWDGYLAMPPGSLADTLLLAEELAPVASPLYWAPADRGSAAAAPKIEIALDEEKLSQILVESADEVKSLTEALK